MTGPFSRSLWRRIPAPNSPSKTLTQLIFLGGLIAVLFVLAHVGSFPPQRSRASAPAPFAAVRVRKNIEELSKPANAAELNNLRHAFDVLIQRSLANPDDPNGYIHFANFHNDQDIGPCDHLTDIFQAWHRAHLVAFEKALQEADPNHASTPTRDVMLPYWDWTSVPSGQTGYPRIFEEKTTSDGKPNIFRWPNQALCDKLVFKYCDERNNHAAGVAPYPASVVNTILRDPWNRFGGTPANGGSLEFQPHNYIHGTYVGSDMGDNSTAAYDPIFWFFHTNIDRLMESWQQINQQDQCAANPDPTKMTSLNAAVRGGGHWPPTGIVKDFICIEKLGYQYDQLAPSPSPPPGPSMLMAPPLVRRQDAVAPRGSAISLQFKLPSEAVERAYLEIPGLANPPRGAYEVRVYIHPRTERYRLGNQSFANSYFAGSLVVWNLRHQSRGRVMMHPKVTTYSLNITDKLNETARAHAGENWVVSIVFTPVNRAPGSAAIRTKLSSASGRPKISLEGPGSSREIRLGPP